MEGHITLRNMAIDAGARSAPIAVERATMDCVRGRPMEPQDAVWDRAKAYWRKLAFDAAARFDAADVVDANDFAPQLTLGALPEMVVPIESFV